MALGLCLAALGSLAHARTQPPTRVVRFVPPAALPDRVKSGDCQTSVAAGSRDDAFRCAVGDATYDPCFQTAKAGHVLCDVDPRDPSKGVLVASSPVASPHARAAGHRAWFFELTDGTTCRPADGPPREADGLAEIYACKFALPGTADAVLGELDASTPVWTIQQVVLNKKVEPPTIKSLLTATVKTVWQ
jgi:hypothetical protein